MLEIIQFTLVTIGIAAIFSVPGILLGYWLNKKGIAPNRSLLSILYCLCLTFVQRIWLPAAPFWGLAFFLLAGSTLGVYRMDFYWNSSQKTRK